MSKASGDYTNKIFVYNTAKQIGYLSSIVLPKKCCVACVLVKRYVWIFENGGFSDTYWLLNS